MHDLYQLIFQGEGETLEFKKTITHANRIARTIVSFANTRGGQILVGVQDDGTICGIDPEEEKHTLEEAIHFFCDPPVSVHYEEVDMEQGTVLKVIIPESPHKPHLAKVKEDDWRGYVRVRDESVQTSQLVEKSMQLEPLEESPAEVLDYQEAKVLELLAKHHRLTIKQITQMANLSRRRVQRLLVDLTLQGKIRMHDKEKVPYFTLS
ncbi:ATP-binding protein [Nibribacter ruber]|uniref:ATP-binding protein n=1 Tax=Nibribacter ruber TaxID=2698458 RepID=A0A6P1NWA4_9BACT|nr:ATP-binding protein [Nibribacter ruber]QHL86248.1 ATP-binding protein [Nibribacter ruber]